MAWWGKPKTLLLPRQCIVKLWPHTFPGIETQGCKLPDLCSALQLWGCFWSECRHYKLVLALVPFTKKPQWCGALAGCAAPFPLQDSRYLLRQAGLSCCGFTALLAGLAGAQLAWNLLCMLLLSLSSSSGCCAAVKVWHVHLNHCVAVD